MGKKIVQVEVKERSPWGESVDDGVVNDPTRRSTFIGGYSDVRTAFESETRAGNDPRPLQHRFQWARAERPNGDADGRKVAQWKGKGYSKPTWEEVEKAGYDLAGSAAVKGPDGTVHLGDTVLMWCPARTAAAHAKRLREETKAASDAYQTRVEDAVEDANRKMGYKPGSHGATKAIFELEHEADKKG